MPMYRRCSVHSSFCSARTAPTRRMMASRSGSRPPEPHVSRIAELPDHPFFLATLFQPELAGDGTRPHPIIRALAAAAATRSSNASPRVPAGLA
jgi:CTP synthase (UTP-ammonia lyase)